MEAERALRSIRGGDVRKEEEEEKPYILMTKSGQNAQSVVNAPPI